VAAFEGRTVAVRLISDVQADPVLRRLLPRRFYLPRRAMNLDLVQQAIAAGNCLRDTRRRLLIERVKDHCHFRRIIGHERQVSDAFASELGLACPPRALDGRLVLLSERTHSTREPENSPFDATRTERGSRSSCGG